MPGLAKLRRPGHGEKLGPAWRTRLAGALRAVLGADQDALPPPRSTAPAAVAAIIVVNHVSHVDPFLVAKMIIDGARVPRFLAKDSIFACRWSGAAMRGMGNIPVSRGHDRRRAVARTPPSTPFAQGHILALHPEGTVTRDPDGWPMVGKTGAARLALLVPDVPVIPVAQWGVQDSIDLYRKRVRLFPRPRHDLVASASRSTCRRSAGATRRRRTLHEMTEVIMRRLRDDVADLRGVPAPTGPLFRRSPRPLVARPEGRRVKADRPRAPGRGARRSRRCSSTPATTSRCGPGAPSSPTLIAERHENPDYLPGIALPPTLHGDPRPCGRAAAGPTSSRSRSRRRRCAQNLAEWVPDLPSTDATLVSLMKGVELGTTHADERGDREVTGASAVDASPSCPARTWRARSPRSSPPRRSSRAPTRRGRSTVQQACSAPYFRPYTNTDVVGCELGGAVKNVIALACGMAAGMGFGAQHPRLDHHPRAGRDVAPRRRAGRRPADVRRAGRSG